MSLASKRRRAARRRLEAQTRVCASKKRYRSPDTAQRKADVLTLLHTPTWAYKCPVCEDFHLTTKRRRPRLVP